MELLIKILKKKNSKWCRLYKILIILKYQNFYVADHHYT